MSLPIATVCAKDAEDSRMPLPSLLLCHEDEAARAVEPPLPPPELPEERRHLRNAIASSPKPVR